MKLSVLVVEHFGAFCADGEAAAAFRREQIDLYADMADVIELDFAGVRNANSSFCNALLAGLVAKHSPEVIKKLKLLNCRENLKIVLSGALELGLARWQREGGPAAMI
jgi:hypothetical protein